MDFIGIIEGGCASESYFVGGGRPSGHVPPPDKLALFMVHTYPMKNRADAGIQA